jgi:hypothetical protein
VKVHWRNVTGSDSAYDEKFEAVAAQYFSQYVDYIGNNTNYSLPDTK